MITITLQCPYCESEDLVRNGHAPIGVDDNQLRQLYQRAHAVVLPSVSYAKAFRLALVEGMAAGCVPIASDLPGVREVVGRTGYLFPAGDANRLATILCSLRDDPALVQQISDRARVHAAGFGRERAICEHERLITGLIACRDLKDRLADQTQSYTSALHVFATAIVCDLQADWTQIVLGWDQGELYSVASTRSSRVLDHRQLQRASALFAQYALNTGESTLLGPNTGPAYLRALVVPEMPAVMVTPLTRDAKYFRALLSMREQPFDQCDLDSLTRFAGYAAPSLHTLVKTARVQEDR